jgi:DNA-binding CsgD family transcriptional regulator
MRTFSDAILGLYSAVLDPEALPDALAGAAGHLGAEIVSLESFSLGSTAPAPVGLAFYSTVDEALLADFVRYHESRPNPRVAWALDHLDRDGTWSDLDVMPPPALARHPFHQELLRPHGVPFAMFGFSYRDEQEAGGLSAHFASLDAVRDPARRERFEHYRRHVRVAERIARRLGTARTEAASPSHEQGRLLFGRHGTVVGRLGPDVDRLAEDAGIGADLRSLDELDRCAPRLAESLRAASRWARSPERLPGEIEQHELANGVTAAVLPVNFPAVGAAEAVAALALARPADLGDLSEYLRTRGLTATERALCVHLLRRGTSLETFARLRGTRIGTVRHQIKQVMSKLGVNSQLDVVRLLNEVRKAGRPPGSAGQGAE